MRTKIIGTLLVMLVCVMAGSCTRNDGDIGDFFGIWRVTSLTIDDEPVEEYGGTLYFMFQSSVYGQKIMDEEKQWDDNVYASWRQEGNTLIIDFSDERYEPFAITGMSDGVNYVDIVSMSSKNMELSYINPEGVKYGYVLKKW